MPVQSGHNKQGRPPKPDLNWENFEKLCAMQCPQLEVAAFLKLSLETLKKKVKKKYKEDFSLVYERFRCQGKTSLRRLQFQKAQEGNVRMLIHLGKSWLKQNIDEDEDDADKPIVLAYRLEDL